MDLLLIIFVDFLIQSLISPKKKLICSKIKKNDFNYLHGWSLINDFTSSHCYLGRI